jgi:hypothetical protein
VFPTINRDGRYSGPVQRKENKTLKAAGDERLAEGSCTMELKDPEEFAMLKNNE